MTFFTTINLELASKIPKETFIKKLAKIIPAHLLTVTTLKEAFFFKKKQKKRFLQYKFHYSKAMI